MRRPLAPVLAAVLAASSMLLATGCTSDASDVVRPSEVELQAHELPGEVHVGLVVTLDSTPGEGSEWADSAAGARVATYQYDMAGQHVLLDVLDDKGTDKGLSEAVDTLAGRGVSGIVVATAGRHVGAGLEAARHHDVPLVLPYATSAAGLPDNAWLTGPTADQLGAAVRRVLGHEGWRRPLLVSDGVSAPSGIDADRVIRVGRNQGPGAVVHEVTRAVERRPAVDAVVLAVPADTEARIVGALQGAKVDVPVVLGRDGVSPAFSASLADAGGSLAGNLTTVGVDASDVSSMGSGEAADRAAGFFSALRIAAGDPHAKDLFGQGSFTSQAGSADIASHDAVVAIVTAAAKAGSASAADVLETLDGLRVTGADGLAGPDLDFTHHAAVPDDAVSVMHATAQDPGVRPATAGARQRLFWFAVPAKS